MFSPQWEIHIYLLLRPYTISLLQTLLQMLIQQAKQTVKYRFYEFILKYRKQSHHWCISAQRIMPNWHIGDSPPPSAWQTFQFSTSAHRKNFPAGLTTEIIPPFFSIQRHKSFTSHLSSTYSRFSNLETDNFHTVLSLGRRDHFYVHCKQFTFKYKPFLMQFHILILL